MIIRFKLRLNEDWSNKKRGHIEDFYIQVSSLARYPIDKRWDILEFELDSNSPVDLNKLVETSMAEGFNIGMDIATDSLKSDSKIDSKSIKLEVSKIIKEKAPNIIKDHYVFQMLDDE